MTTGQIGKKLLLTNGEPVIICKLGDDQEYTAVVKGKSFVHVLDNYIVELTPESKARWRWPKDDYGHGGPWDCICLTEACLKRPK